MSLTSHLLGDRRIVKGDEVITVAAGFPTTVAPIVQFGAVPVFVDITIPQYNVDVALLEEALSPKTKAVVLAHTMGNPFDLEAVGNFCKRHNLWLLEDNCDALGAEFRLAGKWHLTGTIGDLATSSFYPAHHITTGEGGAVFTRSSKLKKIASSLRDWGRDCWCLSGKDNTCGKRFKWQSGELPHGYDHKYIYSHLGYNLKATEMQAAVGLAQLKKLDQFIAARRKNWLRLRTGLADLEDRLILPEPIPNGRPSWFGFAITLRGSIPGLRDRFVSYLEGHGIQTRMLFAGNLLRQPCWNEFRGDAGIYRVVGNLVNTDIVMANTFWVGVYPGLTEKMVDIVAAKIRDGVNELL